MRDNDDDKYWFRSQILNLTDKIETLSPSEWAEQNRYLPDSVTSMPGYYRYDVAPYLREIADCFDQRSPVREVTVMKGAQVGATVGVLENVIGYLMAVVKSSPCMLLTAESDLARTRMDNYITPMIQQSGLSELICSNDEQNSRKEGKTAMKIEHVGGGFIIAAGARNAGKLRSISIRYLLGDEVDGYLDSVGKDGCPMKLAEDRTNGYEQTRKIARISTPLIDETSKVKHAFYEADQRYYHVPCKHCGEMQILKFSGIDKETGQKWGLEWETENGILVPESVVYRCQHCGGHMRNADKVWMFPRGEWKPTAQPKRPNIRSYHISALYSPASMKSWESCVSDWLDCWDEQTGKPRDVPRAQRFYNNVLGKTWKNVGQAVKFQQASSHRREEYKLGQVPNSLSVKYGRGGIQLLTMAIDAHKGHLDVAVFGWSETCTAWLVDYWTFYGNGEDLDDPVWMEVRRLIEDKVYQSDDGKRVYKIQMTLLDSSWSHETMIKFCSEYTHAVYPILGRDTPSNTQRIQEFGEFTTQLGTRGYRVTVDLYKDRWATTLRKQWIYKKGDKQPAGMFNGPVDLPDAAIKEMTVEIKQEKRCKTTNKLLGWQWIRPSGVRNELWDLLCYNNAALDMIAWGVCQEMEMESVSWLDFWNMCERNKLFWSEAS